MMREEEMLWISRNILTDGVLFPRKVSIVNVDGKTIGSQIIKCEDEFEQYLRKYRNVNVKVNLFSEYQYENGLFDTFWFNIDGKGRTPEQRMADAFNNLLGLYDKIKDLGFGFSRVYYTGQRFCAFVDFELTSFNNYRFVYDRFIEENDLGKFVDVNDFVKSNLASFVGCKNYNTKRVVMRIYFGDDVTSIKDMFWNEPIYVRFEDFGEFLKGYDNGG